MSQGRRRNRSSGLSVLLLEDRTCPTDFTNSNPISIPGVGSAGLYPSPVSVSGLTGQQITNLQVLFNNLSEDSPANIDALLVAPTGQQIYLMSDAGGVSQPVSGATLTFSDAGAALTTGQLATGTYRPTNIDELDSDNIPGAPAGTPVTTLAAFNGLDPNGVWELRVVGDGSDPFVSGNIAGGWTLRVTARANTAPVGVADTYAINEDTVLTTSASAAPFGVLQNDTDAESDPLTAQLVTGVSHGVLTFNTDGSFVYTPAANYHGTDSFTYRATDGTATSSPTLVTLTIASVNDVPVANDDALTIQNGGPQTLHRAVLLNNDIDPDVTYRTTVYFNNFEGLATQPFSAGVAGGDGTDWGEIPAGWSRDNGSTPTGGPAEFFGWHPMDIDSWIAQQGNQDRAGFARGGPGTHGTVLVADGDALDDFVNIDPNLYSTLLTTPAISLAGINENSLQLEFDSSYRPEDPGTQLARVSVSFDNGPFVQLSEFNTNNTPGGVGSLARVNDHLTYALQNPAGAASVRVRFGYELAGNDWWWAVDNIQITGDKTDPAQETIEIQSQPAQGSVSVDANGAVIYTPPTPSFTGSTSFAYRLNDGVAVSNTATVTLTVNANAVAPVAANDAFATIQGVSLTTQYDRSLLVNDSDADIGGGNAGLRAVLVTGPTAAQGTLTFRPDGTFTFVPNISFIGNATFTYKVNDGTTDSNVATVTIAVTQINNVAPVANNDTYSVNNNAVLTVSAAAGVLANDTDADNNPLVAQLVAGPTAAQGVLALNANGSFTFTPTAYFSGPVTFTYRAFDGAFQSNVATVTITVNTVGQAPVANNDTYAVNNNGTLTVATAAGLRANDTDPENDPLTVFITRGPNGLPLGLEHGTLTLNADGSFTYVPVPFFNGTDSFTYRVGDGSNLSNVATVTITVNAVNVAPQANPNTYHTLANTPLTVPLPGLLANDRDDGPNVQLYLETFEGLTLQAWNTGTTASGDGTDWTDALPTGWVRDNTTTPPPSSGTAAGAEFFGWHAMDIDSWVSQQGNQARSDFTRGGAGLRGTVLVGDGDAYDDFVNIDSTRMNTLLTTPAIPLGSILPNSLQLEFDSSFRPEAPPPGNQRGRVEVSYDNGASWLNLLDLLTSNSGGSGSRQRTNEHLTLGAFNPAGATSAMFRFGYLEAQNDWWWAIDNVKAVGSNPNAGANLTAQLVTAPPAAQGTVAVNADGSFTFTPTAGFTGLASFTYKANDGVNDSAPTPVRIVVGPQAAVQIDDGTAQRSMVRSLTVTFSGAVTFAGAPAAAFQLVDSGNTAVPFSVVISSVGGATVATLTFSGSNVIGGSLADGSYTLTILSSQVTIGGLAFDGDGDGTPGGDRVTTFSRKFGDQDGDGDVDTIDLARFRQAFGSTTASSTYRFYFDFDGDGDVDAIDLARFRQRFI